MSINADNLRFILGLKLRTLRQERGHSLKTVAEKSGLSVSYLSEIEKGKKYPKPDKLIDLADALDVIVRGIKSGLPLNECLKIIAREGEAPVKQEFQILTEGIAVGVDAEEGLRRMLRRVPLSELAFFSTVLTIQSKTGGNLAEALGNLSAVLRARKMMREKVGALSSEAKASAFIIGSLPPGVGVTVSVISPDYMTPMFTTSMGQMLLLGGGLWMLIGVLVMRGMINFKM